MTVTRNTGTDLLPFVPRPSYPRARLRAMRDAQARRERERPREDFDADRLARDLAGRPLDVRLNDGDGDAATREYLRRMGWTDERLRRAMVTLRESLQSQIHPAVTAGAGVSATRSRPPSPSPGRTGRDLMGMAGNIAAARRMGLDPAKLWPGQVGLPGKPSAAWLVASGGLELPVALDQAPVDRREYPVGSRTRLPANRRSPGAPRPRRSGWQS